MTEQELIQVLVAEHGWSEVAVRMGIRAGFHCEYCDRDLLKSVDDYDTWQVDHIVPLSKGGSETEFENLAVACKPCNFIKRHWEPADSRDLPFDRTKRIEVVRELIKQRRERKHNDLARMRELVARFTQTSKV